MILLENVISFTWSWIEKHALKEHDAVNKGDNANFREMKRLLGVCGYTVYYADLNSATSGLPQSRRRLYCLGVLGSRDSFLSSCEDMAKSQYFQIPLVPLGQFLESEPQLFSTPTSTSTSLKESKKKTKEKTAKRKAISKKKKAAAKKTGDKYKKLHAKLFAEANFEYPVDPQHLPTEPAGPTVFTNQAFSIITSSHSHIPFPHYSVQKHIELTTATVEGLTARAAEILYFVQKTKSDAIANMQVEAFADLSQSLNRHRFRTEISPCLTPRGSMCLLRRRRWLGPRESLLLQGFPMFLANKAMCTLKNWQIHDLAGNAFASSSFCEAFLLSVISSGHELWACICFWLGMQCFVYFVCVQLPSVSRLVWT